MSGKSSLLEQVYQKMPFLARVIDTEILELYKAGEGSIKAALSCFLSDQPSHHAARDDMCERCSCRRVRECQ